MRVSELMTRDVEPVSPQSPVVEAARQMRDADVGALPVGEQGRLAGIVTDRDIVVRAVADGRAIDQTTVGDVLSSGVVAWREDDSVEDAADLMAQHQIRRLPVVEDDQRLVGIVALADIARNDQDRRRGTRRHLRTRARSGDLRRPGRGLAGWLAGPGEPGEATRPSPRDLTGISR
jgi:CBS domain-containing protein